MIRLAVLTEYRRVTDGQTDILRRHSPRYAYASRGKNAIASSFLKFSQHLLVHILRDY